MLIDNDKAKMPVVSEFNSCYIFQLDIVFNESGTGYYPILYINDYWNLATDYKPLNNTVK